MHDNPDNVLPRRFRALRKVLGKTQKEIGESIGGGLRTWQNYETGRSSPSWRVLHALIDMGVNVNWLLTGTGDMFSASTKQQHAAHQVAEAGTSYHPAASSWHDLPLINDGGNAATTPIAFRSCFLEGMCDRIDTLRAYQVAPNTGSRYIEDGRIVIVDTARRCLEAGGYYLLALGDGLSLMLVQRDHHDNVYLHSGNQHYRGIEVAADEVATLEVIGRAIWADRLL